MMLIDSMKEGYTSDFGEKGRLKQAREIYDTQQHNQQDNGHNDAQEAGGHFLDDDNADNDNGYEGEIVFYLFHILFFIICC